MQNDNERACQTVKYCLAGFVRQRGIPPHSWTVRQLDLRKFSSGRAENGAFALNKVKKVPNRALIEPKQAKN